MADDQAISDLATALVDMQLSQAAQDVLAERARQVNAEGYSTEHDDGHINGELAQAARCYALWTQHRKPETCAVPFSWPWEAAFWKPGPPRRMLVKAAALLIAEIERLDRRDGT